MTYANPAALRSEASQADTAALLLRVAMGVLFVAHAWMKITVFTPAGTAQYFASIGLPGVLAYLTIAAELFGGLALIAGVYTRWVSLALVPVMVGAAYFGHGSNGFFFSAPNGGWEYPAFWTVALFVQALLGDGAFALTNRAAR
ncbi:putative membrane protein [Rubellimicrobium mesophilum DSM 19309]|uniref:Putative membrane protein n=1 Tax=Rubellimicrobium mesophilum DSM 19309 TaxID=442562 RepID=A0A017HLM9_9RHOB|nr:DoxX family protein [Rubellimicrobium mesophilum]EYD75271.1 putative membrane protein [Rubellimicrobium mesophilum DSM 19309]